MRTGRGLKCVISLREQASKAPAGRINYRSRALGLALSVLFLGNLIAAEPSLPPLPQKILRQVTQDEASWNQFLAERMRIEAASQSVGGVTTSTTWPLLSNLLPGGRSASNPLLLTDGTVLVHVSCTSEWFKLTPDAFGSYLHGTWHQAASMGDQFGTVYAPRFFASAVLPDGRVIVEGGEYNGLSAVFNGKNCAKLPQTETALGAIYDPVADMWTPVDPPAGWPKIGDASGIVLTDGNFLLADIYSHKTALLDPATLTWTEADGAKVDRSAEENLTLLPNDGLLTVDAYTDKKACGIESEIYVSPLGPWTPAGSTINELSGCSGDIPTYEGPTQILQPNGKVVAFGGTASTDAQNLPVHTAIYDTASATWAAGPDMPALSGTNYTMADAPAAIFPDGNVLLAASPSTWGTPPNAPNSYPRPTHLFGFDGSAFGQLFDIVDAGLLNSFQLNFLVLPTGDILAVESDAPNMQIIVGKKASNQSWSPTITKISDRNLIAGGTYTLSGTQLSGVTSGAAYGDDVQSSTNYPLIRVTNNQSGHVFFARTFNFTSISVAPMTASSTSFTVPSTIEGGASSLVVVANGVASKSKTVTILIPGVTLSPASCQYFPQGGGTQHYAVAVQNPPPGLKLGFDWHLLFGNSAAQGITVLVPNSTIDTSTNPVSYLGLSRKATIRLAAFPGPGFGRSNAIVVSMMFQTKQGNLQSFLVNANGAFISPYAQAQFAQGASKCP